MTFQRFEPLLPKELKEICAYCGVKATTRDHFLPWSEFRRPFWVPACEICNTLLGSSLHDTWADRCAELRLLYKVRYRGLSADYPELLALPDLSGATRRLLRQEGRLQADLARRTSRLWAWTQQDLRFHLEYLLPGSDCLVKFMTAHKEVLGTEPRACGLEL